MKYLLPLVAVAATLGALKAYNHLNKPVDTSFPVLYHPWVQEVIYKNSPVKQSDIVMLGDSLTEKFQWQEFTGCSNLINRGLSSATSQDLVENVQAIKALHPKVVFLTIGTNDIALGKPVESLVGAIDALTKELPIYIRYIPNPGLNPKNPQASSELKDKVYNYNFELKRVFGDRMLGQILPDYSQTEDGIHLQASEYQKWLADIQPVLSKYCVKYKP